MQLVNVRMRLEEIDRVEAYRRAMSKNRDKPLTRSDAVRELIAAALDGWELERTQVELGVGTTSTTARTVRVYPQPPDG